MSNLKKVLIDGIEVPLLYHFGGIASFFLLLSIYLQDGTGRSAPARGARSPTRSPPCCPGRSVSTSSPPR